VGRIDADRGVGRAARVVDCLDQRVRLELEHGHGAFSLAATARPDAAKTPQRAFGSSVPDQLSGRRESWRSTRQARIVMETFPWAFVIIGGPVVLGLAFVWAQLRSSKADRRVDPDTPGDDPSKGM
jgi:hypothetical protein